MLQTSEVVAETSEGRLGLWDATAGYARIGEWPTHGIGPHDVRRLPDGTLVVANGGIATDPQDRRKLNLDSMRPSLAYLGAGGDLVDRVGLPGLAQASIRHLSLAPDGTVAFAMQWEGDPAEPVPLLGLHRRGHAPVLAQTPEVEAPAMQGYAGSIARADDGRVAITSPRGGGGAAVRRHGPLAGHAPPAGCLRHRCGAGRLCGDGRAGRHPGAGRGGVAAAGGAPAGLGQPPGRAGLRAPRPLAPPPHLAQAWAAQRGAG